MVVFTEDVIQVRMRRYVQFPEYVVMDFLHYGNEIVIFSQIEAHMYVKITSFLLRWRAEFCGPHSMHISGFIVAVKSSLLEFQKSQPCKRFTTIKQWFTCTILFCSFKVKSRSPIHLLSICYLHSHTHKLQRWTEKKV